MTSADAQARALAEEAEAAEAEAAAAAARARAIRLRQQARALESEKSDAAGATSEESDAPGATSEESDAAGATSEGSDAAEIKSEESDAEAHLADTATSVADEAEAGPARRRRLRLWRRKAQVNTAAEVASPEAEAEPTLRRWRLPGWKALVASLAVLCMIGLVTAGGWMIWKHRQEAAYHHRQAEFAAAARQSVVTLMSLDFNHVKEDVQRIIDNTTGQFKQDFQNSADDFSKVAQDSKVITEATVNDTAVESMTDNSAVVLVSATSRVTNGAGANQEPRSWRLSVTMQRDGDQIKMSKAEFVP